MTRFAGVCGVVLFLAAGGRGVAADEEAGRPVQKPSGCHTDERAGYPRELSPYAQPGVTPAYGIGYIGGSRLFHGSPRSSDQGIFGWDYIACGRWPHRLFLGWSNGHDRARPIDYRYRTDGPKVPDPFSKRLLPAKHHCEAEE